MAFKASLSSTQLKCADQKLYCDWIGSEKPWFFTACKQKASEFVRQSVASSPPCFSCNKNRGRTGQAGTLTGRYIIAVMLGSCTEPRTWPSMPHFLSSEGLMQSHVRGVGNWDPIKRDPALSPHERGPFPNKQTNKLFLESRQIAWKIISSGEALSSHFMSKFTSTKMACLLNKE